MLGNVKQWQMYNTVHVIYNCTKGQYLTQFLTRFLHGGWSKLWPEHLPRLWFIKITYDKLLLVSSQHLLFDIEYCCNCRWHTYRTIRLPISLYSFLISHSLSLLYTKRTKVKLNITDHTSLRYN